MYSEVVAFSVSKFNSIFLPVNSREPVACERKFTKYAFDATLYKPQPYSDSITPKNKEDETRPSQQ